MHPFTTTPMPLSAATGRRIAPRSPMACAALLTMALAGSAGAQVQPVSEVATPTAAATTLAAGPSQAAQAASAGAATVPATTLTREQVIAELQCARASGELDAAMLNSYGLPPHLPLAQRPAGEAPCATGPGAR